MDHYEDVEPTVSVPASALLKLITDVLPPSEIIDFLVDRGVVYAHRTTEGESWKLITRHHNTALFPDKDN